MFLAFVLVMLPVLIQMAYPILSRVSNDIGLPVLYLFIFQVLSQAVHLAHFQVFLEVLHLALVSVLVPVVQ